MPKRRAPRPAGAASYSRYSTDLQQTASITDQQRKCRDGALRRGLVIDPPLEIADEAVSGTKRAREGLDRLLAAARAGRFGTLIVESLSRLARESIITMPLMKELVNRLGIRVLSIDEGIDTDQPGWEMMASIRSVQHEQYIKDLSAYVFRGQEGAVLAGHCVGDMCLGYASEPEPGSETTRRGRHPKPRMRYVIDPEAAEWVRRIFRWFALEKRSMSWIARELTLLGAPKDHRATTAAWHPQYVRRVLSNPKYIGLWSWGRCQNERDPFDGTVTQCERPAEERAKWDRHLPELRIIDDELWAAAQARLAEVGAAWLGRRRDDGRLSGPSPEGALENPRHLLAGLLHCEACGLRFQVCGGHGAYLGCRGYRTGQCRCATYVPRDRAADRIVGAIAARILACPAWHAEVLAALRAEHEASRSEGPARLEAARKRREAIAQKIARLVDLVEAGTAPSDVKDRLAERRVEAQATDREIAALEAARSGDAPEPTEAWVAERLKSAGALLASGGPAAALALRDLVGGMILLRQIERPGRHRHHLQARFEVRVADVARHLRGAGPAEVAEGAGRSEEIVLDLRELAPWEEIADEAKALWDRGLRNEEIAARLRCNRNQVTKAIAHWHRQRGLQPPDGRSRRRRLDREAVRGAPGSLNGDEGDRAANVA